MNNIEKMQEFRSFLRKISPLTLNLYSKLPHQKTNVLLSNSNKNTESILEELKSILEDLNETHVESNVILPNSSNAKCQLYKPIYYCGLIKALHYEISVFGFRDALAEIPLHNHLNMYAFLKVIKGKILLSSFSFLEELQEQNLIETRLQNIQSIHNIHSSIKFSILRSKKIRPLKFEGSKIISASENFVAILQPKKNNIHSIKALEDGAAFLDLLIPGYVNRDCTYYAFDNLLKQEFINDQRNDHNENNQTKIELLKVGEIYWFKEIEEPSNYQVQSWST